MSKFPILFSTPTKRKADASEKVMKKRKRSSLVPWNTTSTPYSELATVLEECNRTKNDDERTTILAEFFEQVLRESVDDIHHWAKLLLNASYRTVTLRVFALTISSESHKTRAFEEENHRKSDFVGWSERAKQVKRQNRSQPKLTFVRPKQPILPLTVEDVVQCLDQMDILPRRTDFHKGQITESIRFGTRYTGQKISTNGHVI